MFDRAALIAAISARYDELGGEWWSDDDIPDYLDYVTSDGYCDGWTFEQIVEEVAGVMREAD